MRPTATLLSVTLLATAWAEEAVPAPAPAPAPAAEVPAPVVAAPTAEAPATPTPAATPAPAAVAAPAAATPTAAAADDVVLIAPGRRVKPAVAPTAKQFSFGISLGLGYDSNILLENTDVPTATDEKGLATFGEVRGQYRLVDSERGRLGIFASTEINDYPSARQAQLIRYGGGISASTHVGGFDPGLVATYNRFLIDSDLAANAFTVNGYVSKIFTRNVAVLGVGSQYVDYAEKDPISGTLYDVNYRHWFLFEDNRVNRRFELTLKVGKNRTRDDDNAYRIVTPGAGLLWRVGDTKATAGTQDISARISYEFRQYPDPAAGDEAERQRLFALNGGYDYFLASWLSLGGYGGLSQRHSNDEANKYDRFQTGLRLNATW